MLNLVKVLFGTLMQGQQRCAAAMAALMTPVLKVTSESGRWLRAKGLNASAAGNDGHWLEMDDGALMRDERNNRIERAVSRGDVLQGEAIGGRRESSSDYTCRSQLDSTDWVYKDATTARHGLFLFFFLCTYLSICMALLFFCKKIVLTCT